MHKTNSQILKRFSILSVMLVFLVTLMLSFYMTIFSQKASAISEETRPTLVGREIHMGPDGGHVKMMGVNIWGIETVTMDGFGDDQYADRVNVVNTVKSWGANHVRFRLQASDYNAETYMTKAEYLNRIDQWRDLITSAGMYFMPVWWDAHDGPHSGVDWETEYNQAFPMMTDVLNTLGDDPMVMYEPFNEPTGAVDDVSWVNAMKGTISHFRDNGYTGILLIDPRVWAHCFDDADFDELEAHDAAETGMNGTHQIIFTKHDYAREFSDPDAGFDETEWAQNDGGCEDWDFSQHAVWESEYGNYSIDPTSVHPNWSNEATTFMHDSVCEATGPLAGATAFLFGPWLDSNAMTAANNTTPTVWGGQVDNNFLVPCDTPNGIGTLGNLVFYDKNRDGVYEQSEGDTPIQNVTLAIYSQPDSSCSVASGATPFATATTNSSGRYLFSLLPTDDGISANGAGAKYAVVVTDTNGVLTQYQHTSGTANTNDNSQSAPTYCAELTNAVSDIQYADFGFGPKPGENPGAPGAGAGSGGGLADTGLPVAVPAVAAAVLLAGGALLAAQRYIGGRR